MTRVLVVASLSLLVACSQKKDEERVAPPQSAPVTGTQPAPPPTPPGAAAKLTCEAVFPKPLQDKYFAGATVTDVPQATDFAAGCKVMPAGATVEVELNVTCHDNVRAAKDTVIASIKDMEDLAGVGAPGRKKDLGEAGTQIMAWDEDSNCQVIGVLPKGVDAEAFLKDLLAQLPPS